VLRFDAVEAGVFALAGSGKPPPVMSSVKPTLMPAPDAGKAGVSAL
jgi:hypothetical protein